MSEGKLIRLADAREHVVDNEPCFYVETGPSNVFAQQVAAQAGATQSLQTAVFVLQPASVDTLLVRDVSYFMQGSVTVAVTPSQVWADGNPLIGADGQIGFAETVGNFIQNEIVNFGSVNQVMNPQYCLAELSRLNTPSRIEKAYFGGGPTTLDSFNSLAAVTTAATASNPLLAGADVVQSDSVTYPRGQGIYVTANPNKTNGNQNAATLTFSFALRFKSSHSFLRSQAGARPGIRGQSAYTITLNCNTILNLFNFVFPQACTVALSAATLSTYNCEVMWITPSPEEAIPWSTQTIDCVDVQTWTMQSPGQVASGGVINIPIANIQSDCVPNVLLISCVPNTALAGAAAASIGQTPMQFMPPNAPNMQLQFNNLRVYNGFNVEQLYDVSRRNGYYGSLEMFCGDVAESIGSGGAINQYTASGNVRCGFVPAIGTMATFNGGFLVARPSRDFGISSAEIAGGVRSGWSLSGTASFVNNTAAAITGFTLRVTAIVDSMIITDSKGGAQFIRGVCSKEQYAMARIQSAHHLMSDQVQDYTDGFGGSFWGSVGNFFKGVGKKILGIGKSVVNEIIHDPKGALRTVTNLAEKATGYIPQLAPVSGLLGKAAAAVGAGDGGAMLDRRHHTAAQKRALARSYLAYH